MLARWQSGGSGKLRAIDSGTSFSRRLFFWLCVFVEETSCKVLLSAFIIVTNTFFACASARLPCLSPAALFLPNPPPPCSISPPFRPSTCPPTRPTDPSSASCCATMSSSHHPSSGVHPVLGLINRCDALAQSFDTTFEASCTLLTNLANGVGSGTMEDTLTSLRATLQQCEDIVNAMLGCIYEDIPHLLDQLDTQTEVGVGNFNPKQALDGISQLFYVRSTPPPLSPPSFHCCFP